MEHPIDVAYCPLFFSANGGQFDALGRPIFREGVAALCDKAFDCGHCPLLHQWVHGLAAYGWEVHWECEACVKERWKYYKGKYGRAGAKQFLYLPGFYQAGRKTHPLDSLENDPDNPGLEGCTKCSWETSFLQLVLIRKEPT